MKTKLVAVIGGGPAGSVAALCLRKLGRDVILFERQQFPRYRIGESLLPGTISILSRLGLSGRIAAAGFPVKKAATFLWGEGRPPWSFTFSTPKTAPWVYDHAYQVTRSEFDKILLDAAIEHGTEARIGTEVTAVDVGDDQEPARLTWKNGSDAGILEADFVVDASGAGSIVARQLGIREFDEFFRNIAVWSYFKGGRRYKGDLEGNIFSVTWKEGWIWIIPLKDDIYSVGVVSDLKEASARMKDVGPEVFYRESLESSEFARDLLANAKRCDEIRVVRDWAYSASTAVAGRVFLCGDSAMFIDPLFSQGVHLATYSGMMAAAGIDRLYGEPDRSGDVRSWFDASYKNAYDRYHRFLSAFYAYNNVPESSFWSQRKIQGAGDKRFAGREWFQGLTGQNVDADAAGIEEVEAGAGILAELWHHESQELTDEFDQTELSLRRMRWAAQLHRDFRRMTAIRWTGREVRLVRSFKVHPTSFGLEDLTYIADETGRAMTVYSLGEDHRALFESLLTTPLSYKDLTAELDSLDSHGTSFQIIGRLIEQGLLEGLDENGKPVKVRFALRFGGVGGEDDLS